MGRDFTNFHAGCHGPVPFESPAIAQCHRGGPTATHLSFYDATAQAAAPDGAGVASHARLCVTGPACHTGA